VARDASQAESCSDVGHDASLIEVFFSSQGEGPEVGRSTVFVRFGGCDLRCRWCDTPQSWRRSSTCRIETDAGLGRFEQRDNPIPVAELTDIAMSLATNASTWISLTGGEPLMQPAAVARLARELRERGQRVYLETHGLHERALSECVENVDLVSMDWKLTSDVDWGPDDRSRSGGDFHDAHESFLRTATQAGNVYVKVVVTPNTLDEELDEMIARITAVSSDIPLIIQPVTPTGGVSARPAPEKLLAWLTRAEQRLTDVRLIPQTHPIYGVL